MTKKADPKNDAGLDEQLSHEEAAKRTTEYLSTILHMIRRQVEISANAHIATQAALKAIGEKFPDISASYERHYAEDLKTSETAVQTRQIVAALDVMTKQAKYGS